MRNKRWKREAKKIHAECNSNLMCKVGGMKVCKYYDRCGEITPSEPCNVQLRDLEILCKKREK